MTMDPSLATKDDIYRTLREILVEEFECEEEAILPSAHVVEDLGLDSIDAVDMMIIFQEKAGKKLEKDAFKSIQTVQDIIDMVHELVTAG